MRRTRLRRRNPERHAERLEKDFGPLAEFVRQLPCIVCGTQPCDPAHVRSRGACNHAWVWVYPEGNVHQAYEAGNIVPLCRTHHNEQGHVGILSFQRAHGIDLAAEAESIGLRFRAGEDPCPLPY